MEGIRSKLDSWAASLRGKPRQTAQERPRAGQPHDAINDDFHDAYGRTRCDAHEAVPIAVVLGDQLVLFHRGERHAWCVAPRGFHVIKSIAHAPLGIYATLAEQGAHAQDDQTRARLQRIGERLEQARAQLAEDPAGLNDDARRDLREVLARCLAFLGTAMSEDELQAFAAALGPVLLRMTDEATKLQLDALHEQTDRAFALLDDTERERLQIVVAGDHQARERSLAMQYFQKRMHEPKGQEKRVTYAEAVADEQAAIALVGTRRLDHAIGRAFFRDEARLQRDILGDAAKRQLAERTDL